MTSSLIDSTDLTPAERLIIARRRDGMTQDDYAAWWGVERDRYKRWESGRYEPDAIVLIGQLEAHEECFLLRRRGKITRRDLADDLGVSLTWLTLMERGRVPVDRLFTHWSQNLDLAGIVDRIKRRKAARRRRRRSR